MVQWLSQASWKDLCEAVVFKKANNVVAVNLFADHIFAFRVGLLRANASLAPKLALQPAEGALPGVVAWGLS
jgi:hypothetical protein